MNTASAATETAAFAARLGDEVRPLAAASAKGQVIGVFSHAMYCVFGGSVVSLYGDAYGEVPFGIALSDILGFLAAADASVGRSVTLGADAILFDERRVPIRRSKSVLRRGFAYPTEGGLKSWKPISPSVARRAAFSNALRKTAADRRTARRHSLWHSRLRTGRRRQLPQPVCSGLGGG